MPGRRKVDDEIGPGKCRLCPRWEGTAVVCMEGSGPKAPELVVVGEAPAKTEDAWCRDCQSQWREQFCRRSDHRRGQPFVGAAGRVLRRALADAGYSSDRVFFTNIVRCSSGGTNPTMLQSRKCRGYLLDELISLDYKYCAGIVLLGQSALRGFFNNGDLALKDYRLRVLDDLSPLRGLGSQQGGRMAEHGPTEAHSGPVKAPRRRLYDPTNTQVAGQGRSSIVGPARAVSDGSLTGAAPVRSISVPVRVTYHPAAALQSRNPELYEEIVGDLIDIRKPRAPLREVLNVGANDIDKYIKGVQVIAFDLEWSIESKQITMVGICTGEINATTQEIHRVVHRIAGS